MPSDTPLVPPDPELRAAIRSAIWAYHAGLPPPMIRVQLNDLVTPQRNSRGAGRKPTKRQKIAEQLLTDFAMGRTTPSAIRAHPTKHNEYKCDLRTLLRAVDEAESRLKNTKNDSHN